jgi:hypothetical protein
MLVANSSSYDLEELPKVRMIAFVQQQGHRRARWSGTPSRNVSVLAPLRALHQKVETAVSPLCFPELSFANNAPSHPPQAVFATDGVDLGLQLVHLQKRECLGTSLKIWGSVVLLVEMRGSVEENAVSEPIISRPSSPKGCSEDPLPVVCPTHPN